MDLVCGVGRAEFFFHLDLVMTTFVSKSKALMSDDDSAGCVLLKVCQLVEF
jgi:hypothetical protein